MTPIDDYSDPIRTEGGLLTPEEAARYLATSERAIHRHWLKRELAAVKVGRRVRFRREDLDAFVAANRVDATVNRDAPEGRKQ